MARLDDEMHNWLLRPLRKVNAKWQELKSLLANDRRTQLWYFCSPTETWTGFPHCGWEGYAVVKEGKIVDFILTALS